MTSYRRALSSAQNKLNAAIDPIRNLVPHSGEIGTLIEQQFRYQLVEVLPEKIGVSHGFVMDSNGGISKQMDLILYDRLNTPRIFASDGAQIFPVEATYACGEIKTYLDSDKLKDSFEKCSSYKNLCRKAYFKQNNAGTTPYHLFGHKYDHWQSIYFCLAVESINASCLSDTYTRIVYEDNLPTHKRIDTVMSLSGTGRKNCLLNVSGEIKDGIPPDKSIDLLPKSDSKLCTYRANEPWALFTMLLLKYMTQAPMEPINMLAYGGNSPY
ncbi:hypothetical protein F4054_04455 [Candidatus Poribacteria bacterium]|nr:hypothetical protein [Candidatus Poribacteria bacterium]MYK21495.1 hypothetical protein [Candidatus Poribacteria bacterium]